MELVTISEVSKILSVSTRTLRYYEEIGLISSSKKPDYAYRVYDVEALKRLQLIITLRKLSVSLKQIRNILQDNNSVTAINVFNEKINEINEEANSLSTVKTIIKMLIQKLEENLNQKHTIDILNDETVVKILDSAALVKKQLKEKKTMKDLKKASENLSEIKNVRIIFLPPATVASSHCDICDEPERKAGEMLREFIDENQLYDIKPDFRVYGFNNPNVDEKGNHGYEFYVTIPHDLEVKIPLTKKHFEGGLYAAHCIKIGDFHEWQQFGKWLQNNEEYDYERREPYGMEGTLEEHLNAYNYYKNKGERFKQLDLLIPIKKKR